jgi:branched-subunit amino acid aminotransferase/4-amino-4-deoxychorismate lyase
MSAAYIQANTAGRLHPATEPSLSPLNRGFLYGDAIYEVWRTYHGVVFAWQEHWDRLKASARALRLALPFTPVAMLREIRRTVDAYRRETDDHGEVYIRLQISRGAGPIGLDTALADRPEFVLLVQACPAWSAAKSQTGLKLSIARELRRNPEESLSPAWKTGNYLNNILGLREARARGADEVLMLNLTGEITEAAVSNVAFIRDREILTPPLAAGILSGVTRKLMLECVTPAADVHMRECTIRPEDLATMDECFLLSSTKDLQPVVSIDRQKFKVGPRSLTLQLKRAFAEYTRAYAASHSKQTV